MNNYELFFGRFQPFHRGHLRVVNKMKNPVIAIVKGKITSTNSKKNPLDFEYQKYLIQKVRPDIKVIEVENGYLPDIIKNIGTCPDIVYAGADRIKQYAAQIQRANKELDVPMQIQFGEMERTTSGSVVREAIRSDDKTAFKANVPRAIWDEFLTMKQRFTKND